MAEGILRAAAGDILDVQSAGSHPCGFVDPLAIKVLAEIGIDISRAKAKDLRRFLNQSVETVITVCSSADRLCPVFPGQVNRHYWPFRDPGHAKGPLEERMKEFRRVRDKIKAQFEQYAAERRKSMIAKP